MLNSNLTIYGWSFFYKRNQCFSDWLRLSSLIPGINTPIKCKTAFTEDSEGSTAVLPPQSPPLIYDDLLAPNVPILNIWRRKFGREVEVADQGWLDFRRDALQKYENCDETLTGGFKNVRFCTVTVYGNHICDISPLTFGTKFAIFSPNHELCLGSAWIFFQEKLKLKATLLSLYYQRIRHFPILIKVFIKTGICRRTFPGHIFDFPGPLNLKPQCTHCYSSHTHTVICLPQ